MHHLVLNGISWCSQHGCPVVSLRPEGANWQFWITFSAQDAEAMAAAPLQTRQGASLAYQLLETVTDWLEAEVGDVRIHLDAAGALGATVRFDQPLLGSLDVPVSVTEGIILAWRRQCPLRVDDATLAFIKRSLLPGDPAPRPDAARRDQSLAPGIRDFIESLNFEGPESSDSL
jgi:bifunctional DNase/RNase